MKPDKSGGSISWQRYLVAFAIAAAIFVTALYVSNAFNTARVQDVRSVAASISTDILSLETQFDLLQELPCDAVNNNSVLPHELSDLGTRLAFTENQLGSQNSEVLQLKRQYTLLEIKDYLLLKKISAQCSVKPAVVLYFYSNTGDCPDCEKQGYVLTSLLEQHPELRVYSFDYNLDVPALDTLKTIYGLHAEFPALVVDRVPYYGLKTEDAVIALSPELAALIKSETATSTTPSKK